MSQLIGDIGKLAMNKIRVMKVLGSYFEDGFIKMGIFSLKTRFGRDSQQLSSLTGLI